MIFFQYFQFKSHNCDYEGTKAFTECYRIDDLQKSKLITQESKLITHGILPQEDGGTILSGLGRP